MAKKYIVKTEHQLKQIVIEDKSAVARAKASYTQFQKTKEGIAQEANRKIYASAQLLDKNLNILATKNNNSQMNTIGKLTNYKKAQSDLWAQNNKRAVDKIIADNKRIQQQANARNLGVPTSTRSTANTTSTYTPLNLGGTTTKQMKDLGAATRVLSTNMVKANKDTHGFFATLKRASVTVPAFYGMASAIMAIHSAMGMVVSRTLEYDKATRTLAAVLSGQSLSSTRQAADEFNNLSVTLGGLISDYEEASLLLARSGIGDTQIADLTKAVQVTAQLSLITGESLELAASAIITFKQAYSTGNDGAQAFGGSIQDIGNKIAYMANASKLSLQDIGTFSNYAVSAGKAAGLTQDALNGMAIAFSNAGNKASTIGTQIRRFTATLTSERDGVKKLYESIGVNRTKLNDDLQKSVSGLEEDIRFSNDAFKEFVINVAALDQVGYNQATAGMAILDKQFFDNLRNNSKEILENVETSFNGVSDALDKTGIIADSFGNRWEAMRNKVILGSEEASTGATAFLTGTAEGLMELAGLASSAIFGGGIVGKEFQSDYANLDDLQEVARLRREINEISANSLGQSKEQIKLDNITINTATARITLLKIRRSLRDQEVEYYKDTNKHSQDIVMNLALVNAKLKLNSAETVKERAVAKLMVDRLKDRIKYLDNINNIVKERNGIQDKAILLVNKSMELTKENATEHARLVEIVEEELKVQAKINLLQKTSKEDMSSTKAYIKLAPTEDALIRIGGHIETNRKALDKYRSTIGEINGLADDSLKSDAQKVITLAQQGETLASNKLQNELIARIKQKNLTATEEEKSKNIQLLDVLGDMTPVLTLILQYAGLIRDTTDEAADAASRMSAALGQSAIGYMNALTDARVIAKEITEAQGAGIKGEQTSLLLKAESLRLTKELTKVEKDNSITEEDRANKSSALVKQRLDIDTKVLAAKNKAAKDIERINERNARLANRGTRELEKASKIELDMMKAKAKEALLLQQLEAGKGGYGKSVEADLQIEFTKEMIRYQDIVIAKAAELATTDKLRVAYQNEINKGIALSIKLTADKKAKEDEDLAFNEEFRIESPELLAEIFDPYEALIKSQKDYAKNIKEAGKDQEKIDKINAKAVSNELKGYGNLVKGAKGFFKEGSKGYKLLNGAQMALQALEMAWYIKKNILEGEGLALKLSAILTGTEASVAGSAVAGAASAPAAVVKGGEQGGFYGIAAMALIVAALGFGVGVSSGSSGEMSAEEEKVFGGYALSEFSDESLANLIDMYEDAQYPLLKATYSIDRHLNSMDTNFYSIARAIAASTGTATSDMDITGSAFEGGIYDGGLFSSKSTELLGAGIKFQTQTLEDMMGIDTLYAQGYKSIKTVKEYLWKTSIKYYEQLFTLDSGLVSLFADTFAEGYMTILEAGVLLGLDETQLASDLLAAQITLGGSDGKIDFSGMDQDGIADALSNMFSDAFSQVISQVDDFDILIDRYTRGTEAQLETLMRIALEYDQASFQFGLIGKSFIDVTTSTFETWTETLTRQIQVPMSGFLGLMGLVTTVSQSYSVAMSGIVESTYTAQMQILDIVESTGGIDNFNTAMSSFMSNFYTDAEQLGFMQESLNMSFTTLGLGSSIPETNDEFRTLLETMDTTTEEGAYLYGQVLLLAEGFAEMTDAADSLEDSIISIEEAIGAIADAWLGSLSYLTNAQKTMFADEYAKLASLPDSELDRVEATRLAAETALKTTTTKEEYIPVFDRYIAALEAEIPEATLDDVLGELREITIAVKELEDTTIRITV